MAIVEELLSFQSVGQFFAQFESQLRVPGFQRPYSWKPQNSLQTCQDVARASAAVPAMPIVLGTVILHRDVEPDSGEIFNIFDGQRLVTLMVLRGLLQGEVERFSTHACGSVDRAVGVEGGIPRGSAPRDGPGAV